MIYANVRAHNKGPLPDIELTHIYERIIDVMRALQRNELASERNAQGKHWRWHASRDPCQRPVRPRQGRSNDRSNAGKSHRRTDRAVIEAMVEAGVNVHRTTGATQTILAGVGPTASLDLKKFEMLPGVLHVHRISSPYKLAGRALRPEGTVVEFANGAKIGGEQIPVIAGPCSIETRDRSSRQRSASKQPAAAFCAAEPSNRAVRRTPSRAWAFRAWSSCAKPPRRMAC